MVHQHWFVIWEISQGNLLHLIASIHINKITHWDLLDINIKQHVGECDSLHCGQVY